MKFATWAALGAGATVASALVSASAILYRGSLFTEEGTSKVVSFFFLNRGKGKSGLRVEVPPAAATKGSAKPSAHGSEALPIDPALRRRAVPTAVKALAISTAMAATVGSLAAAVLMYTIGDDDGDAIDAPERSCEEGEERASGSALRRFLEDSFKGG